MNTFRHRGLLAAVVLVLPLALAVLLARRLSSQPADTPARPAAGTAGPANSYYYYGPNGLWKQWHAEDTRAEAQRLGRDTWIHWTWGNQKTIRKAAVQAGQLPVPISIDFFRLLDSRNRGKRFRDLGLINEPNCAASTRPDAYGLYLDRWQGDPLGYYPMSDDDRKKYPADFFKKGPKSSYRLRYSRVDGKGQHVYAEPEDRRHYGRPSGVVGLRLFDNPAFDDKARARWDVNEYFRNPGKMEPPYLVGFTCAFCHIAFEPTNPPTDPENPRWDNLAANVGNQYLREGELLFGKGRVAFGDKHPDPLAPGDPYRTRGLMEVDFLYHYAVTQQPGTSETSRISYDFINNPNTINPIYGLRYRPTFTETTAWNRTRTVMRVLKDGADSIGLEWALMRVPINIGCEGDYWLDHLFRPASGKDQRPVRIAELLAGLRDKEDRKAVEESLGLKLGAVSAERLGELRLRYRSPYGKEEFGHDWQEAWRRVPGLAAYLASYEPSRLSDVPQRAGNPADREAAKSALDQGRKKVTRGDQTLEAVQLGARVFDQVCGRCHDGQQDKKLGKEIKQKKGLAAYYQERNYLADDTRYAVRERHPLTGKEIGLGTNMARALATNAVDNDVWSDFSSKDYKAQPSIAPATPLIVEVPVFHDQRFPKAWWPPVRVEFDPPAGGRGYYRTPSLISMWATAPYLHNNSVGDYWVRKQDEKTGKTQSVRFPNDGSRIGGKRADGTWEDYAIDVSVRGRLLMFEDAIDKLLNPHKRRRWVKRTSADSSLIPDPAGTFRQLVGSIAADVLRNELRTWLRENRATPAQIDHVVRIVDTSLDRVLREVLRDVEVSARFAWTGLHLRKREHADRLLELLFDDLKGTADLKLGPLPLDRLKLSLRRELLAGLDRLDRDLREAALLRVPAGFPVNLYANLHVGKLPHALLAHARHRDDRRALALALLQMSACPDLVEDGGHTYGAELSDADKAALIEFLKTL